ncbi:sigma intracellular receptor 2 [Lingula anatina]|uniref:Sigma intracellular receptor 2 n=1 Tax=Lingula anatina TaxID=7574 RepID=A0A1S3K228_LINAN|nr:sigma intracellular receptor 2 [Lingula anatina]|eukprot:XP_013416572.1 sigma intracellular receptor 2 [Lingula anatina]
MIRIFEWIFCVFFGFSAVWGLVFDSFMVYPKWLYPEFVPKVLVWYTEHYKDPLPLNPPEWLQAFAWCEQLFLVPFSFVAAYAFYKGKQRWIRIPSIIYATHVLTMMVAYMYHLFMHDFSKQKYPGPTTSEERQRLITTILPFGIIPVLLLVFMVKEENYGMHGHFTHVPRHHSPSRRSERIAKRD